MKMILSQPCENIIAYLQYLSLQGFISKQVKAPEIKPASGIQILYNFKLTAVLLFISFPLR